MAAAIDGSLAGFGFCRRTSVAVSDVEGQTHLSLFRPLRPVVRSGSRLTIEEDGVQSRFGLPIPTTPGWVAEFRAFVARGNVVDLAIGIIICAAFTGVVNSFVKDVINPLLGCHWRCRFQQYICGTEWSKLRDARCGTESRRSDPKHWFVHQCYYQVPHYCLCCILGREGGGTAHA
jgi:hypothetical protein